MDNEYAGAVVQNYRVPQGEAGGRGKVKLIWQFIRYGWSDPKVIRQAEDIVRFVRERDPEAEARAIYDWVKSKSRYTTERVEKIKTAGYQIGEIATRGKVVGDCDDAAVLIGALAGSIGLMIQTVILKDPLTWYHIYPEVLIGNWMTMDVVGDKAYFGRVIPGEKIIVKPKGETSMMGDIMISEATKIDAQGNVYRLEGGDGIDGLGKSKAWKKVGKIVEKVAKVALPVTGIVATTLWAKGAIERAAKAATANKAKIAAAKARGNIIITDSSGREQEVPIAPATPTMVQAAEQKAAITTPAPTAPPSEEFAPEEAAPERRKEAAGAAKKDNTIMYVGLGALALLFLFGKKKGETD